MGAGQKPAPIVIVGYSGLSILSHQEKTPPRYGSVPRSSVMSLLPVSSIAKDQAFIKIDGFRVITLPIY
jgi:hypothetical protein